MLIELARGLYRVRGTFGSNVYIVSDDVLTFVDAGFPIDRPAIHLALRQLRVTPADIDYIITTHYHGDHTGTISSLQGRYGVRAAMHEEDVPFASGESPQHTTEAALSRLLFYTVLWPLFRYRHFKADRILREGEVLDILGGLEVIHTPGHSSGSICLYSAERSMLFSGDLLRNEKGILEGPPPHFTPDPAAARRSLERVAELDFDMLLPGHGEVILENAGDRYRALLERNVIWPAFVG